MAYVSLPVPSDNGIRRLPARRGDEGDRSVDRRRPGRLGAADAVETAVRKAESKWDGSRSSFREAAIGMTLAGTDGRWLQVNRAFSGIVGYSEAELLGMTFEDVTHPEDLGPTSTTRAGCSPVSRFLQRRETPPSQGPAGRVGLYPHLRGARPARRAPYLILQVQEVTERRQTEEALRKSEARPRAVFDTGGVGISNRIGTGVENVRVGDAVGEKRAGSGGDKLGEILLAEGKITRAH